MAQFVQVVSIAQSSVTFKQVDYGLGYPISMESSHQLLKFEQVSRKGRRYYFVDTNGMFLV